MSSDRPKIVLAFLQICAFWSVWRWYFLRLSSSADDFYGILALATVTVICIKYRSSEASIANFNLIFAALLIFTVSFTFVPPLLRAAIAVTVLTLTISGWIFGRKFHFGIWSLFLLSLPVVSSMQFYLGFPLRALVGEVTAFLLKLNGLNVFREGVCLHFGEQLIWIDAPCSGIKMLWAGFFLTSLLVFLYDLRLVKAFAAFGAAFVIILLGNIFRATGLFYLEIKIVELPPFAHEAIGVSAFLLTCIAIIAVVVKIKNTVDIDFNPWFNRIRTAQAFSRPQTALFITTCLLSSILPLLSGGNLVVKGNSSNVVFPVEFEHRALHPLGLSEREEYFLSDFPGEIRRFTDGRREIIIRYVTEATRKLHPASDCFSAVGYQIKPLPLKVDADGQKWACFSALRAHDDYRVCERIYTDAGESWTDVSSWYWSALGSENKGYWAMTVAESAR